MSGAARIGSGEMAGDVTARLICTSAATYIKNTDRNEQRVVKSVPWDRRAEVSERGW